MKRSFKIGQNYTSIIPTIDRWENHHLNSSTQMDACTIKIVERTQDTVSFVYDEQTASKLHMKPNTVITRDIATVYPRIKEDVFHMVDVATEAIPSVELGEPKAFFYATDLDESALKRRSYVLAHWKEYGIAESEEAMVKILNILETHDENLDSMHDVTMGNREECCGITFWDGAETDREVVETLYDFNIFYQSLEEMKKAYEEWVEDTDETVEEFVKYEDIRKTADGYVRVLEY